MVDWLKECFFPMRYMMGRKYNIVWPFGIGKYVSKYWLNNITTWFNENGVQTWLKNQFKHSIWLSPFVRVCFLFDFGSIFWHDVIEILCQQNTKLNHFKMMSSYSLDNWVRRHHFKVIQFGVFLLTWQLIDALLQTLLLSTVIFVWTVYITISLCILIQQFF